MTSTTKRTITSRAERMAFAGELRVSTALSYHNPGLVASHLDVVGVVADGGDAVAAWAEDAAGYEIAEHGVGHSAVADEGGGGQRGERAHGRAGGWRGSGRPG